MKPKLLLLLALSLPISSLLVAQKNKQVTGFAITASQKGQSGWKEVRLINIKTGEELRSVYKGSDETEILNARTGKPITKKDFGVNTKPGKKLVNLDMEINDQQEFEKKKVFSGAADQKSAKTDPGKPRLRTFNLVLPDRSRSGYFREMQTDKPFATNSAACAYDKKHDRLYYTPMGINQLRYIDLKSKSPRIYYFEDESFGVVRGMGDVGNQIPRMVIASDGNGYALTNNANHLVRFTTGKHPVITDLGALMDDPANKSFSVRSPACYGGDMIADASGNLYLVTGNRNIFKISIDNKIAIFQGTIKGLPARFTTNGAMVEDGSNIIVCSSQSTEGYYRVDLANLQAEKISGDVPVFNASDLANGNLAFKRNKREKSDAVETSETTNPQTLSIAGREIGAEQLPGMNSLSVYPNPVTTGAFKLSFIDQPLGRYQVQLLDISGQLISSRNLTIQNKMQIEEFKLPEFITKGNYLVKVRSESNKISIVEKITVE